jgi:hypothetical protein
MLVTDEKPVETVVYPSFSIVKPVRTQYLHNHPSNGRKSDLIRTVVIKLTIVSIGVNSENVFEKIMLLLLFFINHCVYSTMKTTMVRPFFVGRRRRHRRRPHDLN